ncbi:phosphatase PAP2 family protein [Sneathiella marina]|uniref:Phosphatase PAP2 family protein n=1 Tax=Sneathiella marina TaxID=2950108 RepID=A0ABY4WB36_9PROT|nr:phosphatase PAP2 family protein [Sneathiella marina]USG62980.1 phosphatase PAP2 family protein [Sneathiella marina]
MFETAINRFLQSFSTPWLDQFMLGVTWTGDETFIVGILCVIGLGVDFRRGFILLQLLLIAFISVDFLKTVIALPQPFFLDASLLDFGSLPDGIVALKNAAATSFFGAIPESSLAAHRTYAQGVDDYGFPSGHTVGAVVLWGGLALVFRNKAALLWAGIMVVLMMLSRMFLARHFLADVLGGATVGILLLLLARYLLDHLDANALFYKSAFDLTANTKSAFLLLGMAFGIPLIIMGTGHGFIGRQSAYLGINAAFLALLFFNVSLERGGWWQRMIRIVIGFGLFFGTNSLIKLLPIAHDGAGYMFLKGFLPPFILFLFAYTIVSFLMTAEQKQMSPLKRI